MGLQEQIEAKLAEFEDDRCYIRGRDYPAYASDNDGIIKVSMGLTGKEIKRWFKDDAEILDYPDMDGYTGSLP